MKSIVVDASVAIQWFVPEIYHKKAFLLLKNNFNLIAPDLIYAEIGNVLWKKYRSKELSLIEADEILMRFKKIALEIIQSQDLLDIAWKIAVEFQRSFYDSLYVALAQFEDCKLVTADKVLMNALSATHLAEHLLWIEDVK